MVRKFAAEYGLTLCVMSRRSPVRDLSGTIAAFARRSASNFAVMNRLRHHPHAHRHDSDARGACRHSRRRLWPRQSAAGEAAFSHPQDTMKQTPRPPAFLPLNPVAQAYDFPSSVNGTGQTIAILELSGGFSTPDLTSFFESLEIAPPKVTSVSVDGASNAPTGIASGPDGEVELDIEVAGAVAPAAKSPCISRRIRIRVFSTPLLPPFTTQLEPSVISISWGGPETPGRNRRLNAFDSACEDASTMGVTILAASGDDGATDGGSSGTPTVDFPHPAPSFSVAAARG